MPDSNAVVPPSAAATGGTDTQSKPTSTTATQGLMPPAAQNYEEGQASSPTLTPQTTDTAIHMAEHPNEIINQGTGQVNANELQAGVVPIYDANGKVIGTQRDPNEIATATNVDPNAYYKDASGYNAAQINPNDAAQGHAAMLDAPAIQAISSNQAAQGTVDPNSLIENQYARLTDPSLLDSKGIPIYAQNAVRGAQLKANASGLGNSTQAVEAVASTVMQSIFPLAQFDAQQYSDINKINLNNQQQMAITNANIQAQAVFKNLDNAQQTELQAVQNRQQVLLSNQSYENAARQFNAQSKQQNDQFFANLSSGIATANANRTTQVSQFNAGQMQQLSEFNNQLADSRQKFNAQNQLVIDQSNAQWRRQINTANTAADNAANAMNVQNSFNLQQNAQNNVWNEFRDNAHWAFEGSQNDASRANSIALAVINRDANFDFLDKNQQNLLHNAIGSLALNTLVGAIPKTTSSGDDTNKTADKPIVPTTPSAPLSPPASPPASPTLPTTAEPPPGNGNENGDTPPTETPNDPTTTGENS